MRERGGKKNDRTHKFSLPSQNTITPNWSEKWKKYWDKTTLPFLTFLFFIFLYIRFWLFLCKGAFCFLFFFFSFDLPFVMMLFVFSFFGFAKRWVLLLFLLFFSLNFIFIIFLKKTLLDDFLFYFLKCPLSFDKFIRTLFSTKSKSFLYLHFSNLSTKHK